MDLVEESKFNQKMIEIIAERVVYKLRQEGLIGCYDTRELMLGLVKLRDDMNSICAAAAWEKLVKGSFCPEMGKSEYEEYKKEDK